MAELPAFTSFPAPTPFPQFTTPYFGLTPEEQGLGAGVAGVFGTPTTTGLASSDPFLRGASLEWLSGVTGGAIGPGNDPAEWTPDEAAAQTDRALARIAQANPELAQQLAAQHGKSAAAGQDLPWYKDILSAAGEVLHATKLDVVFDYIGRASHIVPEIIHDWGKESVWKNMEDALTGRANDTTWSDVLVDNLGMERSWLTAVLGFAGDVLTDPLSYVTFGAGGLGRAAVGKAGAEAGVESALRAGFVKTATGEVVETSTILARVLDRLAPEAKTVENAARAIVGTTEAGQQAGYLTKLRTALRGVHPDAQPAALFTLEEIIAQDAGMNLIRVADTVFKDVTTLGFQRTSAKALAEFGVDKAAVTEILKGRVAAGTGIGVSRALYSEGKAAAGVLGGTRLRLSIPVLDVRLAGMRLPLMPARMDFSMGRRFFAGMSGQSRLMRMIGDGSASIEDMEIFWAGKKAGGGFAGLRKLSNSPAVRNEFSHGPRSMFYSLSEGIGGATAHLSAHDRMLRGGGLGARYAGQTTQLARHMRGEITNEIQTVTLSNGNVLLPKQTAERIGKAQIAAGSRTDELTDSLNELRSLVPESGVKAGEYYDQLISTATLAARTAGNESKDSFKEALAILRHDKERAVAAEALASRLGKDPELGDIWRSLAHNRDELQINSGLTPDTYDVAIREANDFNLTEAATHSVDGNVYTSDAVSAGSDIGIDQISDKGTSGLVARGLHVTKRGKIGDPPSLATVDSTADPATRLLTNPSRTSDPVAQTLDNASPELRAAVEGNLVVLTPEEMDFIKTPDLVITGPRTTETIDLRTATKGPTEATSVVNPITEIQNEYLPILEDIKAGVLDPSDLPSGPVREIVETVAGKEEQLAHITSLIMRDRGITDLRVITDDAEEVIFFYDDKLGNFPISRVNPRAASVSTHGSQLRAVTEDARHLIQGTNMRAGDRLVEKILRATEKLPRKQAEEMAAKMMAKEGKRLRPHQAFFETNPLNVLEEASHEASRQVTQQFVGQAIRHAENLGLTRGGFGAGAVGIGRYQTVLNEGGEAFRKGTSPEIHAAAEVAARLTDDEVGVLREKAERATQESLAMDQSLDELIEYGPGRLTGILQRLRNPLNDVGKPITREATSIDDAATIKALEAETKRVTLIEAALAAGKTAESMGLTKINENIWKIAKGGATGKVTYLWVEEGKVIAFRSLDAALDGNDVTRNVNNWVTHPSRRGEGIGGELADVHWRDMNITRGGTPTEQLIKMAQALEAQGLSEAGAAGAAKYVGKAYKAILVQAKKDADRLKSEAEKLQRDFDLLQTPQREAINELAKLEARKQIDRAPAIAALRLAEDAGNMTGMVRLKVPGFQDQTMPAFMAEEFELAMRGYPKLDGAHLAFRQFNSWWKTMATWLIPGYHIRNVEGGFFNNWIGGVGRRDYVTSGRIRRAERELASGKAGKWANQRLVDVDRDLADALRFSEPSGYVRGVAIDDLTYADMAALGSGLNLTASNGRLFAEAQLAPEAEARKYTTKEGFSLKYTKKAVSPYVKTMRGAGTLTENVMRTAAFVRGLRDGRSLMEARAFTMMRHGDYEDMTDWEYKWIRDLIPFYKWMRTNTPFQIHQLLESPGKLLAVQKAQRAVYDAKGLDYEKEKHRMPSWMAQGFTIPFGVKEEGGLTTFDTVMLDLPMSDLFMGGRELVSSFLPMVRPFLESYIFEQQTFSGAPLTGKQVAMNPILNPIAPLLDAVGLVERGPDGTAYMTDKTMNLMGILPIYSRFKNYIYGDENSVTKRANTLASAVFGLQLRPVDAETLTDAELSFYYDQILPTVEYLRGQGYNLPTTADLESTIGTTDQILTSLGIRPGVAA